MCGLAVPLKLSSVTCMPVNCEPSTGGKPVESSKTTLPLATPVSATAAVPNPLTSYY